MGKYKVKLPKEFIEFLKGNGSCIDTGNGVYRFLPMWFKDTDDDQVLEIEYLGKLSQDLINGIKFHRKKPCKDTTLDGKKVDWMVFDEECHMSRKDVVVRFERNKNKLRDE